MGRMGSAGSSVASPVSPSWLESSLKTSHLARSAGSGGMGAPPDTLPHLPLPPPPQQQPLPQQGQVQGRWPTFPLPLPLPFVVSVQLSPAPHQASWQPGESQLLLPTLAPPPPSPAASQPQPGPGPGAPQLQSSDLTACSTAPPELPALASTAERGGLGRQGVAEVEAVATPAHRVVTVNSAQRSAASPDNDGAPPFTGVELMSAGDDSPRHRDASAGGFVATPARPAGRYLNPAGSTRAAAAAAAVRPSHHRSGSFPSSSVAARRAVFKPPTNVASFRNTLLSAPRSAMLAVKQSNRPSPYVQRGAAGSGEAHGVILPNAPAPAPSGGQAPVTSLVRADCKQATFHRPSS
ncbi:hypothetical protein V8C86DRAFT_2937610 [Haematococcus lacustris]